MLASAAATRVVVCALCLPWAAFAATAEPPGRPAPAVGEPDELSLLQVETEAKRERLVTDGTPPGPGKKGQIILVSGLEGSGTTSLTRVLCERDDVVSIPGNWNLGELSERARAKYSNVTRLTETTRRFNDLIDELWLDDTPDHRGPHYDANNRTPRPYIEQGLDSRDASSSSRRLREVGELMRRVVLESSSKDRPVRAVVFHRSMPFGSTPDRTPFMHDLPELAKLIGGSGWSAKVVLVLRSLPESWLSHGRDAEYRPFLDHVEQLLQKAGPDGTAMDAAPSLQVAFASYEKLACEPAKALAPVAAVTGFEVPSLLSSPEFKKAVRAEHAAEANGDRSAERLAKFWKRWDRDRASYPLVDAFVAKSKSSCR